MHPQHLAGRSQLPLSLPPPVQRGIDREIVRDSTVSVGAMWTYGEHLIRPSAYDLNLMPPTGTTIHVVRPCDSVQATCNDRQIVLPNLDSVMSQEGRINPYLGQINATISPGINN